MAISLENDTALRPLSPRNPAIELSIACSASQSNFFYRSGRAPNLIDEHWVGSIYVTPRGDVFQTFFVLWIEWESKNKVCVCVCGYCINDGRPTTSRHEKSPEVIYSSTNWTLLMALCFVKSLKVFMAHRQQVCRLDVLKKVLPWPIHEHLSKDQIHTSGFWNWHKQH